MYYAEGHDHQLLAYRSCSSTNQIPLQRPVINKQKARDTSWAGIKESTVVVMNSTDDILRHSFRERSLEEKLEIKRLGPEYPPGTRYLNPAGGLPGPQTPCQFGVCPANAHTHEPPLESKSSRGHFFSF
ncbi:hypothetical protein PoB_002039600 [Plakobranchus ocellatus]|uniref:Uncharacterized protein n=1 Tax=Plakobranchus ocellatus TaxID=259542 RepID=A0AAV3Z3L5_9GAST|nr:hypothetical protein PoB_002039600 [Plakobranchus ocellatus]